MTKIAISIALAIAVVLFNFTYIQSVKQQYESGEFAWVVKAKGGYNAFQIIDASNLTVERVDAKVATGNLISLPGNEITEAGRQYLLNQVGFHISKTAIPDGAILTQSMVADNLEDAFSHKIPSGMRAVTISVNEETGVAGLIRPGDRVDIVGVFEVEGAKGPNATQGPKGKFSQTLLQNKEVLAVGKDTGIGLSEELATDRDQAEAQFMRPTSITLALDPQDAQMIIHIRATGTLSASLRPGPFDPSEGEQVLEPMEGVDILKTDKVILLQGNQAEYQNPFQ